MVAATVSAKVRFAHRGRILLVAIESSIVGLSTGIAILAVGSLVRIDPSDPQTGILLVLVGILSGLSWWMERSADAAAVARSIDRRSGWRGALTTAFEVEAVAIATPVAAALARGLAPRVSTRRFLASEARSSAAVLAAPFLALAFLGAVREGLVSRDDSRALDPQSGASGSAVLDRAADLRARARNLASAPGVSAQDVAALDALAGRVGTLASAPAPSPDPRAALADLGAEFDRLAGAIETRRAAASGAGVAPGAREGTMVGRDPGNQHPADDPMRATHLPEPVPNAGGAPVPGSGTEGGVGASRWWPEHYDGVVERWIEARRAASGGRSR